MRQIAGLHENGPASWMLTGWRPFLWIAVSGLLLYLRTVFFGYTFDDVRIIVYNFDFIGSWKNLPAAFARDPYGQAAVPYYRPLLTLSFMLDALWGGIRPWAYHLSNILYHLTAGCLLFVWLTKLRHGRPASLALALVFIVHPALSQAVAWIPGRNDSLLAVFSLLSFINLAALSEGGGRRHYWLHLGLFGLAILTKETAVLLPPLFLLYWLALARGKPAAAGWLAAGWLAEAALYLLARQAVLRGGGIALNGWAENVKGLIGYAGKVLFSANLSVLPVPNDMPLFWGLAALGVLLALSLPGIKRPRVYIFGLTWALLMIVPTLARITDFAHFLEHRLYLPVMGLLIMVPELKALERLKRGPVGLILASAAILALAALNVRHSGVFADSVSYWENAADTSPSSYLAHFMLGRNYYDRGNYDRAEEELTAALGLRPESVNTLLSLGLLYQDSGRPAKAEDSYRRALMISPRIPDPYVGLGTVRTGQGRYSEAEQLYLKAIGYSPQFVDAHFSLAELYLATGRLAEAERHYQEAVNIDPSYSPGYNGLGLVCLNRGLNREAAEKFGQAIRLDPLNAGAHNNLGLAYGRMKLLDQARASFLRSLELDPGAAVVYDNLGEIGLKSGNWAGALDNFRRAVLLDDGNPVFRNHLAAAHYQAGARDSAAAHYRQALKLGLAPDPRAMEMLGIK